MKHITDSPVAKKLIRKYNIKRVVQGRGHDCGGLIADLCIKSRVIATYHDDGWGGEPEIRFTSDKDEQDLKQELQKVDFAQLLFDNGWEFMKDPSKIDLDTQVDCLVTALASLKEEDALLRKTKRAFIFGTSFRQSIVSWKGKTLADMPLGALQMTYDKYKKDLKKGEKFFNTDEQLISLGIKL